MRTHVLLALFVIVWFFFTSNCFTLFVICVICNCSVHLYLQLRAHVLLTLFVCVRFLFTSSCLQYEAHVLLTLFVFVRFLFTSSCLQYEGSCLISVICDCLVLLYLQLFTVWGLMSYLHYLWLFGSSLPPVVYSMRTHVLLTLFVFVRFIFTSSCLQYEGSCLISVICDCSVPLYLQLFTVWGLMSY